MNILVLNYEFPPIGGGAAPVSKDLAAELVKRGHNITVVTMAYDDLPKQEVDMGIDIHRVKCLRSKIFVCHPWEQLTYLISSFFYISRMMKINSYDVVHAHFIIPTGVLAWWMKKKYKLDYIITAHGSDVMGYNQKRFKILHILLLRPWKKIVEEAYEIISPSDYLKDLMKKNAPDKNYVMIPNGVDTELFRPLEKKKNILVMCRLQETKGVQTVIKAVSCLEDFGDWKLCIAGDGPYFDVLMKMAEELARNKTVEFLGWVKNKSERHRQLVGEAALYVSASRFENSPVSVLEALSAECRVLLSDIPPHRVLVGKEELFEIGCSDELAKKLKKTMESFENGERIIQRKPLDWSEIAEKYENIFNKIYNKK